MTACKLNSGNIFIIYIKCPNCILYDKINFIIIFDYYIFRHLKGEDITSLNYKELMSLEDALENGLTGVRDKKANSFF